MLMAGLRRGSNLPCLADFGFSDFGGLSYVGVQMACSCKCQNSPFVHELNYRLRYKYVLEYCFRLKCSSTTFGLVGAQVCPIR